jgi:uncharacterized protein DUF5995
MSLIDELTPEYRTFDDVLASLGRLQEIFYDGRDRRAVFVSAYLSITGAVKSRVLAKGFLDNEWVTRYDVAFANRYRSALLAYECGDLAAVPDAWKLAFDAARHNDALIIQDLMLGINAHVNRDLPFALAEASIDPDRPRRFEDHTAVNETLLASTDQLESRIESMYAPGLDMLGRAFHPLIGEITSFDLAATRQLAWDYGVSLTDARDDHERGAIARRIEAHSAVLARLILAPTARRIVLDALGRIEAVTPWWRFVALPDLATGQPAPVIGQPPAVNSLDELLTQLASIVERYDSRRSRMALDGAAFSLICRKINEALAGPNFGDPAWITRLSLQMGTLYLNAVSAFETGRLDDIPECRLMAFQSATSGENLLLQDLVLGLNARLNYDLAVSLLQAGMDEATLDQRRADLESLHRILRDAIIAVEQLAVAGYSGALLSHSLLAGPLQGILSEFAFDRAHETAWNNALALARASSQTERQKLLLDLDRKAGGIAQRILLKGLPAASWVVLALRHVEDEFRDRWSLWLAPEHAR